MKKLIVTIIASFVIVVVLLYGTWELVNARSFQLFGGLVDKVDTEEKVVALTFDDGPTEKADEILKILEEKGVRATFFLNGDSIEQYPGETKAIIEAGHEIGNHTYSHPRMVFKSYSTVKEEVDRTDELIREAGYEEEVHFRPPFGKKLVLLPYYLNQQEKTTIMWNIEPESYPEIAGDSEKIIGHVNEQLTPGSIILLHVMYDNDERDSLEAVPGLIDSLQSQGYKFKTVTELLEYE
ncbi:polysaccharide deacetylase family protein [Pseudalkalibacillus sp. A8]|uniref:polysaccharide deacetylase family protein n=1 Tax=Pseudalkalibacillus sp. A8 TaxID=3382641 RepID=UPI0038B68526